MSSPITISSEERIVVALACLIGILFLLFAPLSCKPGATAFSLSSMRSSSQVEDHSNTKTAPTENSTTEDPLRQQPVTKASSQVVAQNTDYASSPPPNSGQVSRTRPLEWSSSRLTEAEVLNSLASSAAGPATPQSTESTPSPRDSQQEALIAAQKQENAQKQNEDFLQQIEELAAETNALKKERRERISKFAETKNEYAATLKFARDQQQQKLLALQKENRLLAEKLAALSGPNTSETPQEAQPSPTPSPQEGQPPQAPAFAQSDDDLDQSRRVLVNAIRDMDALSGDALATRYQELETKLGTKSSGRVRFVSGSSQANATEVAKIEELAKASKTDSQFLIVGFADRSGSASGNRRLSSKRAKFVAEQLGKKVGNSRVQAIYIGQTARFGPAAENRVVEIWQIPATPPKQ